MVNKDTFQYFRAPQQPVSPVVVVKPAGFTDAQRVLAVSLQGVVAKERPQIYIDYTGENNTQQNGRAYLDMLSGKYGFSVAEQRDPACLLQTFRDKVRGYILADFKEKNLIEKVVAEGKDGIYDSKRCGEGNIGI